MCTVSTISTVSTVNGKCSPHPRYPQVRSLRPHALHTLFPAGAIPPPGLVIRIKYTFHQLLTPAGCAGPGGGVGGGGGGVPAHGLGTGVQGGHGARGGAAAGLRPHLPAPRHQHQLQPGRGVHAVGGQLHTSIYPTTIHLSAILPSKSGGLVLSS